MQVPNTETLLVVDDDETFLSLTANVLKRTGYETIEAESVPQAEQCLRERFIDLVLIDEQLGRKSGVGFMGTMQSAHPGLTSIIVSGGADLKLARRAMQAGAADILSKTFGESELLNAVRHVLDASGLTREARRNRWVAERTARPPEIVGDSAGIRRVLDLVGKVAATSATVLIEGETGAGKELIAKAIHMASPRRLEKFVPCNMGAIPKDLIGSKLFGAVKGSFTGATADQKGLFQEADKGTLFLDEIGEAPPDVQAHLLRVLAEKAVARIGENIERKIDLRLVTATNRDLAALAHAGQFREDLLYRLNVVRIAVPPLRDRLEDIEPIANHFLREISLELGKPMLRLAPESVSRLRQYSWPGNVRELRNVIERAAILASQELLTSEDLRLGSEPSSRAGLGDLIEGPYRPALLEFERSYFSRLLQRAEGSKTKAAELSQLDRATIYNHLERLSLK